MFESKAGCHSTWCANENTLGRVYDRRAKRASRAHDLDRCVANQEFDLRHYREALGFLLPLIWMSLLTKQDKTSRRLTSYFVEVGNFLPSVQQ